MASLPASSSPAWPLWLALAVPSVLLLAAMADPEVDPDLLVARSGQVAGVLLVAAIASTGLARLLQTPRLIRHRRAIGLAAFGTSLTHLGLYAASMGALDGLWAPMLAELDAPGIWTAWAALALLLPLALTSTNAAQRRMGAAWKRLQRLAWPAVALALAHSYLVHDAQALSLALMAALIISKLPRFTPERTLK